MWTQKDWEHVQGLHKFKPDENHSTEEGKSTQEPSLIKKLFVADSCLHWRKQFSSMKWDWVYPPMFRRGQPAERELHDSGFYFILFYF